MSSLIFYTDDTQALIATDTLAVDSEGKPAFFTTKAFIVPHMRMVIAGTGVAGFATRWFASVNDSMAIAGISNLDFHAPKYIAETWREIDAEMGIGDRTTATIYHFGFCEETGKMQAFAYRSTNGFQSDKVLYGLGAKPDCAMPDAAALTPSDFASMMVEQRAIQSANTTSKRIHIGGEINAIHLTVAGFNVFTIERFDDYATTLDSILGRHV